MVSIPKVNTLDSSTYGYHFIGVHALGRHFAEIVLNQLLYSRDTGRTTYQDNFVNIRSAQSGIADGIKS